MAVDDQPARPRPRPASGTILRVLTNTQNASAAVFAVFAGVHLAAPIAAAMGGTEAADSVMLLGREYYLPLEPVVVYSALGVHVVSSIARRAVLYAKTGSTNLSTHSIIGYMLIPLVVPHLMLHRLIPQTASPPISSMSPSEFGYEFVGNAVATRPWMTAGYVVLTAAGLWHGLVGAGKVFNWAQRLFKKSKVHAEVKEVIEKGEAAIQEQTGHEAKPASGHEAKPAKRPKSRRVFSVRSIVMSLVGVVCIGLVRMGRDVQGISTVKVGRYTAVFDAAPWARIGLR